MSDAAVNREAARRSWSTIWRFVLLMQEYINSGHKPNAAAERVVREQFQQMGSKSRAAAVAWLKANQRQHRLRLQAQLRNRRTTEQLEARMSAFDAEVRLLGQQADAQIAAIDERFRAKNPYVAAMVQDSDRRLAGLRARMDQQARATEDWLLFRGLI